MKSMLIAIALALASSAATAAAPDKAHAFVYLGHVGDDGKLDAPKFSGVPVLKISNEKTSDVRFDKPHTIVAVDGMRLHATPRPTATPLGRLPKGTKVQLLAVHASFGYVWGEVDVSKSKVLALDTPNNDQGKRHNLREARAGHRPRRLLC